MVSKFDTPNGAKYTVVWPRSRREWEAVADDIQPDPDATKFNKVHRHRAFDEDKKKYCKKKGYAWRGK